MEPQKTTAGYVVANGIDRRAADRLKASNEGVVVSRNADGTYRVTKGR